jgi:hypothetical protein
MAIQTEEVDLREVRSLVGWLVGPTSLPNYLP